MISVIHPYQMQKLDKHSGIDVLRQMFRDHEGLDYTANWLFLSTSGVHGTYTTLEEISRDAQRLDNGNCWHYDHEVGCECGHPYDPHNAPTVDPDGQFCITVQVLKPRTVQVLYGNVYATLDDIPWLREAVRKTIEGVKLSQMGNLE
jgi:hypothetical protein